jgi:hypothetical protein
MKSIGLPAKHRGESNRSHEHGRGFFENTFFRTSAGSGGAVRSPAGRIEAM